MAPTPGYTPGHVSVIVRLGDIRHFWRAMPATPGLCSAPGLPIVCFFLRVAVHTLMA